MSAQKTVTEVVEEIVVAAVAYDGTAEELRLGQLRERLNVYSSPDGEDERAWLNAIVQRLIAHIEDLERDVPEGTEPITIMRQRQSEFERAAIEILKDWLSKFPDGGSRMQTVHFGEAVKVARALATAYQVGGAQGGDLDRKLDGYISDIEEVLREPSVKRSDYLASLRGALSIELHTLNVPDASLPNKLTDPMDRARVRFFEALLERLSALDHRE